MSTVVITGASGLLGGHLLRSPAASGHAIRALSRSGRTGEPSPHATWMRADLISGEGVDTALAGADVIVHAASAPAGDTRRTDVEGTRRLVRSAQRAGIRHVIYVSIVGVDRIGVAYYRHKLAAEAIVTGGGVPWTIVRGTQFHEFMDRLAGQMTRLPVALVPSGFRVQPMDPSEFAHALWSVVDRGPSNSVVEVAGPAVLTWEELVSRWMTARGMRKPMLRLPLPGRVAAALRRGDGTAPAHAVGTITWDSWLERRYGSLAESRVRRTS